MRKNRSSRTLPESQHVRGSMSTAFIEDDGDPVLRSPQHLSETSNPSHGRLAACVPGAAVPRQMQDVPAYGGVCRTLHKNCEQREQQRIIGDSTHLATNKRPRVTPLRGPRGAARFARCPPAKSPSNTPLVATRGRAETVFLSLSCQL